MRPRAVLSLILSFVLAGALCPQAFGAPSAPEADDASGDIIVVYDSDSARGFGLMDDASALGIDVAGEEVLADSLGDMGTVSKVTLEEGADVEKTIERLNATEGIAFAQPNYLYDLIVDPASGLTDARPLYATSAGLMASAPVNDPLLSNQYYLFDWDTSHGANVAAAWENAKASGSVTVAVLDSGITPGHPDLAANIETAYMADAVTGTYGSGAPVTDVVGHGTHVAGIIAAVADNAVGVAGVSYNARVVPVKVVFQNPLDTSKYVTDSAHLLSAYRYLEQRMLAGDIDDLHVINLSLGSYGSSGNDTALQRIIASFRNSYDVLTVCAGGNGDADGNARTDPIFPGDLDECLAVTALSKRGTNLVWSDYNLSKDISAPGDMLLSTYPTSSGYSYSSGTSMACPVVAGIAALMWAADPDLSVDEAVAALTSTAIALDPAGENYRTPAQTGSVGAVDAAAALEVVLGKRPPQGDDGAGGDDGSGNDGEGDGENADGEENAQAFTFPEVRYVSTVSAFTDIPRTHWILSEPVGRPGLYLSYVYGNGIITGYSGGTSFGPDDRLKRGDLALILYRLASAAAASPEVFPASTPFRDVNADDYFAKAVAWCYAKGIVGGYAGGVSFGPMDDITREQLAKIIAAFASYTKHVDTTTAATSSLSRFPDRALCSDWGESGLAWCVENAIVSGMSTPTGQLLNPQGFATRAETAKIIAAAIQAIQP